MEISQTEQKIAVELVRNGRISISQIAKSIGASRSQAETAKEKLEKNRIIKSYVARIAQEKFCAGIASMRITIRRPTAERVRQAIEILREAGRTNWIAELCGTSHLVCTLLYLNAKDLAEQTAELTRELGELMARHELLLYIEEQLFDRTTLLTGKTHNYSKPTTFSSQDNVEIDMIDKEILSLLSKKARIPISQIKIGKLTQEAIRMRINKLEERQIIRGYSAVVDPRALGFQTYYVRLQLDEGKENIHKKVRAYAHENPEIIFAARTTGDFNSVMTICTKDNKEFSKRLNSIRSTFSEELLGDEFHLILDEHKEVFVPEGLITLEKE